MVSEAGAQHLLGLCELRDFPQLFSEGIEESALRIGFEPSSQLFDLRIGGRLSHNGWPVNSFSTGPAAQPHRRRNEPPPKGRLVRFAGSFVTGHARSTSASVVANLAHLDRPSH